MTPLAGVAEVEEGVEEAGVALYVEAFRTIPLGGSGGMMDSNNSSQCAENHSPGEHLRTVEM